MSSRNKDRLIAISLVVIVLLFLGYYYDFYYDINDDVFMKEILEGSYTGNPSGYNIQSLYPLGYIISSMYRIIPSVPWYGLFLLGSIGLCIYLTIGRIVSLCDKLWSKWISGISAIIVYLALMIRNTVAVQYTIVTSIMVATSVFLIIINKNYDECDNGLWSVVRNNIIGIILIIIGYNLRSEMVLLLMPMVVGGGAISLFLYKEKINTSLLARYVVAFGIIVIGMAISLGINKIAYSSEEWKEFYKLFDSRTYVYDYAGLPEYDSNEIVYKRLGIESASEWTMLKSHNFALDDSINAKMMEGLEDYTKNHESNKLSIKDELTRMQWVYRHRLLSTEDFPRNYIVIILYITIIIYSIIRRYKQTVWLMPILIIMRTIPWLYVIWAERMPDRIVIPLYYMEIVILVGWLILMRLRYEQCERKRERVLAIEDKVILVIVGLVFVMSLLAINTSMRDIEDNQSYRVNTNYRQDVVREYCANNPNCFYFIDVFTLVYCSDYLIDEARIGANNYNWLGGWASKSPLWYELMDSWDISQVDNELANREDLYIITENKDDNWIIDYYKDKGMLVDVLIVDELATRNNDIMYVLQVVSN